jgi:glycosyltransferase involved in cell wall biosynthesis/phospholipid N-methyltransferase
MKLSVLMPVYNESRTLPTIIKRVFDSPVDLEIEILAVDDASTDGSWEILSDLANQDTRIKCVRHPMNRGKGAAIRTAIQMMSGDLALIQDSDLEYDPADYPRLLKPILEDRADAVFGSRFASSPERRVLLYWHSLGNKILTWLTNMLNNLNLTDMETGYKAVRADVLRSLRLQSEGFGIEPEVTTRLAQWGARIYEVPIAYDGRTYAEGKNIGWRDGMQAIWLLFKYRWFDTRFSDRYGHATLESMSVSQALSRWSLEPMAPHLGSRVLEAGAGTGNLTRHLLEKERLVAVEIDPFYTRALDRRWGHLANISVIEGDLEDPRIYERLIDESFDSVLCVNVLEHLDHPDKALLGFARVLQPGGRAIILVPAHQWLYSKVDQTIEHRQRFEESHLRGLLEAAGFEVTQLKAFNRLGVLGWLVNKWTGHTTLRSWQTRLFSWLLPIGRAVERIRPLPGLSWVAIAIKK